MQPERDIVARTSSHAGNSIGALAAYLGRSCGHVWLDRRVVAQGYRFYPWMSDEIPHFFNKRFVSGTNSISVTLQAGLNLEGEDPFEVCNTNAEARAVLEADDYDSSLWLATVTMGTSMKSVTDISDPLFIAKHPAEFSLIAEELVALGVVQASGCPLCTATSADDDE